MFDKSDWVPVKLGDVVSKVEENDRENAQSRFDRFLKVEHMDPESLHIKRWSSQKDGDEINPTFYKIFREGQILFPTRNPHLRRSAMASFDGICGEKTLTLEPNNDLVLSEFIPFLFHCESFYAHTASVIIGSTNPHCRWRDVAKYELLLPPKDQQLEISKLLWSIDMAIEKEIDVLEKLALTSTALHRKLVTRKSHWTHHKVKDILKLEYGKGLSEKQRILGDYSVVSSAGIQGTHNEFIVDGPGVVVGRKGNVGQVTWVENNFWPIDTAYYVVVNEQYSFLPFKFIYYLLKSIDFTKYSIATAVPGLNRDDALLTNLYLPTEDEISKFLNDFELVYDRIDVLNRKINASKSLKKSLVNEVF